MTVEQLADRLGLARVCGGDGARVVRGGYSGDLLSWVMGRARADCVWITIMSNINVAAVASLADVSMVILAEDVEPDADLLEAAAERGINIYSSPASSYELSACVYDALSDG